MKRFEKGKFYHQWLILPGIGIKRFYSMNGTHYALVFAWWNKGFHIVLFTKKDE